MATPRPTAPPIALDAMGGDTAPAEPVRAAVLARKEGIDVILVGPSDVIQDELGRQGERPGEFLIVHAPGVVTMSDHATAAVRDKQDASISVACRLVAEGKAATVVSAGHSGATVAAATFLIGRIRGIDRPAIGTVFPTSTGQVMLCDVGGIVDAKPEWLVQWAQMTAAYATTLFGLERPRVAVLSIGEEPGKGNRLVQETAERLRATDLEFIGNVEPKDLLGGACDVAVCDGFVGNLVLKTGEAVTELLAGYLREEIGGSWRTRLPAGLIRDGLRRSFKRLDYTEYGGAPLLGVKGNVVIAHGRSNAVAILNALRLGQRMAVRDLAGAITAAVGR